MRWGLAPCLMPLLIVSGAPATAARVAEVAGAPGLAKSTASAQVVQRQPPAGSCHARGHGLLSRPDPHCTPGALDPGVTQSDIDHTICRSGYTESVRPPEDITEAEKRASLRAYGERGPLHDYEYDHLVSLELGGARNAASNLWPEPGATPNLKDSLERKLSELVCRGRVSLALAQRLIASDWIAAGRWVHQHFPAFRWRMP